MQDGCQRKTIDTAPGFRRLQDARVTRRDCRLDSSLNSVPFRQIAFKEHWRKKTERSPPKVDGRVEQFICDWLAGVSSSNITDRSRIEPVENVHMRIERLIDLLAVRVDSVADGQVVDIPAGPRGVEAAKYFPVGQPPGGDGIVG